MAHTPEYLAAIKAATEAYRNRDAFIDSHGENLFHVKQWRGPMWSACQEDGKWYVRDKHGRYLKRTLRKRYSKTRLEYVIWAFPTQLSAERRAKEMNEAPQDRLWG